MLGLDARALLEDDALLEPPNGNGHKRRGQQLVDAVQEQRPPETKTAAINGKNTLAYTIAY